jgi:phosphoserine phosphatase RsbU/P
MTLESQAPVAASATIEVISPDGLRSCVEIATSPFLIGRGEAGNHLPLSDKRISRQCAAIVSQDDKYFLEDRGQRLGVFVNGEKIGRRLLEDGDVISLGLEDSYTLVFRCSPSGVASLQSLLTRMSNVDDTDARSGGLSKLNLLLELTRLMHSQLPLDAVLESMLDHAIAITNADRGLLLEPDSTGQLRQRLARRSGSTSFEAKSFSPSQTAIGLALKQQSGVVTGDLHQADVLLQDAQSVIAQSLRSVVAIPLYAMLRANTEASMLNVQCGPLLGVLYLDSRRPAAFSKLDHQILDAVAIESASILDNARLVEYERQRQRIERELGIARDIQQALLPREFRKFPHLDISGINTPCQAVGGDYFDVFPIDERRTAFLIADVSGKGLGAALLTPMLQGALSGMTIGADPVRVFHHINGFLCDHAEVGRYATLFFGILDKDGGLEYINAGHPSPLLLSRGTVTELFTAGSFPVGLVPEATYTSMRARLEAGDTLVLFSDGVTEAEDQNSSQFGVPRLQDILAGLHNMPLDRLQRTIVESVEAFSGGASQADDITLLLVRYLGEASS